MNRETVKLKVLNFLTQPIISYPWDWLEKKFHPAGKLIPPLAIRLSSGPFLKAIDYESANQKTFFFLKKYGQIKANDTILDLGCGSGQVAASLIKFLNKGTYQGFDLDPQVISWCQKNITFNYPNFKFKFIDLVNTRYRPQGKIKAEKFRFPYPDKSFSLVIAKSLFTHLLPPVLENYLRETTRVLKRRGRTFMTFFLLSAENKKYFSYHFDHYAVHDLKSPESAVAYEEKYLLNLYHRVGLKYCSIHRRIRFVKRRGLVAQDLFIASSH